MARELGLRIPQDISIIGYADLSFSKHIDPPLTTIRQDGRQLGRHVAALVLNRLHHPDVPPQEVMVPTQLVVRGSTAVCRK